MKPRQNLTRSSTRPRAAATPPRRSGDGVRSGKGIKTSISTTINRPSRDLFDFWRNFENLPRVMFHVESVQCLDSKRSRWRVRRSEDKFIEWEAAIVNETDGSLIAWESLEGSDVRHAGTIRFQPAPFDPHATEVYLTVEYEVPGGAFSSALAKLSRHSPEQQMREDLRHFKQLMEAGEIPTTAGQSAARKEDKTKKYEEAK